MSLLNRRRTILAKIETTYGTDPIPTGAANAMLVRNLNPVPQNVNLVSRDMIRPYFGNSDKLPGTLYAGIDFEVELAGSGTAGTAPAWGVLMRACGFSETLNATPITGTAQAGGSTTTIKLAAGASAVDGFYNGMPITITAGTDIGQSGVIVGYVGSTKVATLANPFTTATDATSAYSIGACAVYRPISTSFESCTLYFNVDGVLHELNGSRGTVSFDLNANAIPIAKFKFIGIYVPVLDSASPAVTLSAWMQPLACNKANTPSFGLYGYNTGTLSQLTLDAGITTVFRQLIGGTQQALITDRQAVGQVTIEAVTIATKDWWTAIANATNGTLQITHGTVTGNIVQVSAPKVQRTSPSYQDLQGVAMLQASLQLLPSTLGNDELNVAVY